MKSKLLFIAALFAAIISHAQVENSNGKSFQLNGISLTGGIASEYTYNRTAHYFGAIQHYDSDSVYMLSGPYTEFYQSYSGTGVFINPTVSFTRGGDKTKFNRTEFRLGLVFYQNNEQTFYSQLLTYRMPTQAPGTVLLSGIRWSKRRDDLGMNAGVLLRTKEFWKRFSGFVAADAMLTFSVFNTADRRLTYLHYDPVVWNSIDFATYDQKYYRMKSSAALKGTFSAGLELRIASYIKFFVEGRIGLSSLQTFGWRNQIYVLKQANTGIRVLMKK